MADVNPNVHEYGYVFVPLNRITAILPSKDEARDAVRDLCGMGFDPKALEVFVGEEGAAVLDLSGVAQGAAVRAIRNLESLMVDVAGDSRRLAEAALQAGGAALAVLMDGHEKKKDDVVALLKSHHATVIRYWGRWTIDRSAERGWRSAVRTLVRNGRRVSVYGWQSLRGQDAAAC